MNRYFFCTLSGQKQLLLMGHLLIEEIYHDGQMIGKAPLIKSPEKGAIRHDAVVGGIVFKEWSIGENEAIFGRCVQPFGRKESIIDDNLIQLRPSALKFMRSSNAICGF